MQDPAQTVSGSLDSPRCDPRPLTMKILVSLAFALVLASTGFCDTAKEKVIILSWGDLIGDHSGDKRFDGAIKVDTADNMQHLARIWKSRGVDKVLFRIDDFRLLQFMDYHMPDGPGTYRDIVRKAWADGLLDKAAKAVSDAGIKMYMWVSIIDEGCPPNIMYADDHSFPWQSKFFKAHPGYQSCDRSPSPSGRQYLWGVPEFAYPEVRAHILEEITFFSDRFAFEGVFLSFRSHSPPSPHGDQFGFNEPVVQEYQRRYGKDIIRQDFDLDKWRALRGEYFTQFLREVRAHVSAHGQRLALGVPQGEHAGPPVGNMELQWRTWVSENLIDELVVGHHTISRAIYRHHWQLSWGYVQDQDEHVGLPPIGEALENTYGPLCAKHGVRLYVDIPLGNFHRVYDDISQGKGVETPEATAAFEAAMEKIKHLDGIIVDGRPFNIPLPN